MFADVFAGDSFLTLGPWEQAGALGLSLLLAAGLVWLVRMPPLPRWWRVVWAVLVFWLFLWLSPQIYYAYYLMIFEDLPLQIVVNWPPPGTSLFGTTILFLTQPDLPDLARGLLFWLLVLAAAIGRRIRT